MSSTAIRACAVAGEWRCVSDKPPSPRLSRHALGLLELMPLLHLKPNTISFNCFLSACFTNWPKAIAALHWMAEASVEMAARRRCRAPRASEGSKIRPRKHLKLEKKMSKVIKALGSDHLQLGAEQSEARPFKDCCGPTGRAVGTAVGGRRIELQLHYEGVPQLAHGRSSAGGDG